MNCARESQSTLKQVLSKEVDTEDNPLQCIFNTAVISNSSCATIHENDYDSPPTTKMKQRKQQEKQPDEEAARKQEILRQLGIVHLENKVTRVRYSHEETEEAILREAGVHYLVDRHCQSGGDKENSKENNEAPIISMKQMTRREARILQDAGVTWIDLEDYEEDYHDKLHNCETNITAPTTTSTINSSYAEKEVLRRLTNGWSSTGASCEECGMPILYCGKGDLYECVVCGVMEVDDVEEENLEDEETVYLDNHHPPHFNDAEEYENDHDIVVPAAMSVALPDWTVLNCQSCNKLLMEDPDFGMDMFLYCNSCANEKMIGIGGGACSSSTTTTVNNAGDTISNSKKNTNGKTTDTMEKAIKDELGRRLFSGWMLLSSSCPSCDLPLIAENRNAPSVCLRCE